MKTLGPLAAALLAAVGMTGCGGEAQTSSADVAQAPPAPPPLSPAATSRRDLQAKVGPLVELSATPKGEPGRYERLGPARFEALNSLTPTAALYIAASRQCDRLVDIDTRATSREELVWRGRCENRTVFTVFEDDVRPLRSKLAGSLSEAAIAALPPPEPDDGIEPKELDWLGPCLNKFRTILRPGETYLHDTWTLGRRERGQRTLTVSGKLATDAFHESTARFSCRGDVKSGRVLEVAYRARGVNGVIKE